MIINNKIVFIPIPKNASWSVEDTCIDMGLDLTYGNKLWENSINLNQKLESRHMHSKICDLLRSHESNLEYICILRDSTDRLVSAWKFFLNFIINQIQNDSLIDDLKKLDKNPL